MDNSLPATPHDVDAELDISGDVTGLNPDVKLAEFLSLCYADPLRYVMGIFPWATEESIKLIPLRKPWKSRFDVRHGPDEWACRFLDELGEEIRERKFDGVTSVPPIQFNVVSGHGVGKTALVSWIIKFIADTRPFSRGMVTAGTADQLKTRTWAEVGKWHKLSRTKHWFRYSSSRGAMSLVHREYPEQWRCDALTCRRENAGSFQGLHAANSTPYFIFDEASVVADEFFTARQGSLFTGEPITCDFGNPILNSGEFYENCEGRFRHRYRTFRVDSRDAYLSNQDHLNKLKEDYGENSDFFKVRVRGLFPSSSDYQFFDKLDIEEAAIRELPQVPMNEPLVMGVDVAGSGSNRTVLYPRMGHDARSFEVRRYSKLDPVEVADAVMEYLTFFKRLGKNVDGLFIDGQGIGAGVVATLRHRGVECFDVKVGKRLKTTSPYLYKGDEIYGRLRDALQGGLCLPPLHTEVGTLLYEQMMSREFVPYHPTGQVTMVSKRYLIAHGMASPDETDALSLTYAHDVVSSVIKPQSRFLRQKVQDYDPLSATW
ncbi:terminase [bacterium (Candidatus Blackallbacteria) CG18_big_fil_WC_8_21_14_2_50_49_26]|nr:MAG: terminase [bacterium (Candidatus Blackallbacteria) CG18_big_fil_WC_8_21_14_2_50_49_26]